MELEEDDHQVIGASSAKCGVFFLLKEHNIYIEQRKTKQENIQTNMLCGYKETVTWT